MSDVPTHPGSVPRWIVALAPFGGAWMVSSRERDALVVAPPAVALYAGEPVEAQTTWRIARCLLDQSGWLATKPLLAAEPVAVRTSEILVVLPTFKHPWVEGVMREQLEQCAAFAAAHPGGMADEERSRRTAERLADLRSELREAFPTQRWYEASEPPVPTMPDTVGGLLAAIDGHAEPAHTAPYETRARAVDALVDRCGLTIEDLCSHLGSCRSEAARSLAIRASLFGPANSRLQEITRTLLTCVLAAVRGLGAHGQLTMDICGRTDRVAFDPRRFDARILTTSRGGHLALALAAWSRIPEGHIASACDLGADQPDLHIARCAEQAIVQIKGRSRESPSVLALVGQHTLGFDVGPASAGTLLDIPGWAALARSIAGDSLVIMQASDPQINRGRLNEHLAYRFARRPHRDCTALFVQDAIEQRSCDAIEALAGEWTWLRTPGRGTSDLSVMLFGGSVVDKRTSEQGRLVVFRSSARAPVYVVVPHGEEGDQLPHLEIDGAYPGVRAILASIAGLGTSSPREPRPICETKGHLYAEHLSFAPGDGPQPLGFAVAADVSGSDEPIAACT